MGPEGLVWGLGEEGSRDDIETKKRQKEQDARQRDGGPVEGKRLVAVASSTD